MAAVASTAADDGSVLSGDGTGTDVVDAGEAGTEGGFAFGVDGNNGGGAFFGVVGKSTLGGIGYKSLLLSQDIVKTCFWLFKYLTWMSVCLLSNGNPLASLSRTELILCCEMYSLLLEGGRA